MLPTCLYRCGRAGSGLGQQRSYLMGHLRGGIAALAAVRPRLRGALQRLLAQRRGAERLPTHQPPTTPRRGAVSLRRPLVSQRRGYGFSLCSAFLVQGVVQRCGSPGAPARATRAPSLPAKLPARRQSPKTCGTHNPEQVPQRSTQQNEGPHPPSRALARRPAGDLRTRYRKRPF